MKAINISEKCISIIFWMAVFLVAAAFILPFVVPIDKSLPGPDAAGAMAILFFGPMFVVFWLGVAMAVITAIRFKHIRKGYRIMGFSPIGVVALGYVVLELLPAFF
ncbi:MAG: hypothetical protein ACMUIM_01785 [bacterium]